MLGLTQSGRPITLRLLSLAEHREIIRPRATSAKRSTRRDPNDPGMAVLAAPFSDTDRVEYLDKA